MTTQQILQGIKDWIVGKLTAKVNTSIKVNGHALTGDVTVSKTDVGLGNVTNDSQVKRSEMGAASGVATLDSSGKVPSSQLPSYVDDVLEYDTKSSFPATGDGGKIYVDKSNNTTWRWSGSAYTQIKGDLTIGTTSGTAADGEIVNDHINSTSNPHGVTKAQVGLGSVVNTGDSDTPVSGGTTKFTTGGAYTELAKKVDKVSGATAGHLAGLNASGDITDSGVSAEELVKKTENITWADLKAKRDNSQLVPGQWYRITDYVTTTIQYDTQSAGHQFDIIVRADDVNALNENAFAAKHSGDTYFTNAGAKLEAWQLKYTLDNKYWSLVPYGEQIISSENNEKYYYSGTVVVDGTTYYKWVPVYAYNVIRCSLGTSVGDTLYYYDSKNERLIDYGYTIIDYIPSSDANGKGTIYWMKDEFDNECSYDFKNIQFKFTSAIENSGIVANVFYYTFSRASGDNDATITDHSLVKYCIKNKVICIGDNNDRVRLPFNVFRCNSASNLFTKNTIIGYAEKNTFSSAQCNEIIGMGCRNNSFSDGCSFNKIHGIDCSNNTFYANCMSNNLFGECSNNIIGTRSYGNKFENSSSITLGARCEYNTFESGCRNISLGERCRYNTFGTFCKYITFGTSESTKSYCQYIIVENGNQYIYLDCSATTSSSAYFQNVKIAQGVNNTTTYKTITHTTAGDTFQTVYKPVNSVEVSV